LPDSSKEIKIHYNNERIANIAYKRESCQEALKNP